MASVLQVRRLVWGLLFLVVSAAGCFSYFSGVRYLATMRAVEEVLAVQSDIDGSLSLYKDAETGQRGFILTGDEQFMEPYDAARAGIPDRLADLHRFLDGDPVQRGHLAELERLAAQKFAFIEDTIRLRREGDLPGALAVIRTGRGKALMDSMRTVTRAMTEHEQALLRARRRDAETAKTAAAFGAGTGSIIMVMLALFGLLTVNRDVGELRRTSKELAASEEHFRLLTENSNDLVRLLDLAGTSTYVSPSVERLLGFTRDEFMALPGRSLLHPDELGLALSILEDVIAGRATSGISTYQLRHKSGEYRLFEVRWSVMKDESGKVSIHTAGRDVTERQHAEEQLNAQAKQLRELSLRDELSQLYNRRGFLEVAGQSHTQAKRDGRSAALIFIDLNGMKRINDELGHDAGDDALKDTAHVLKEAFRDADVVARLGGDEFVVFALDFLEEGLGPLRERIRELADLETNRLERPYRLSMSVGGAFMEAGWPCSLETLLERADAAMYEQKRARQAAGSISVAPATRG